MKVKGRLQILGIYLLTGMFDGPGAAYASWRQSCRREQRFRALYGRMYTYEEIKPVIDGEYTVTSTNHGLEIRRDTTTFAFTPTEAWDLFDFLHDQVHTYYLRMRELGLG